MAPIGGRKVQGELISLKIGGSAGGKINREIGRCRVCGISSGGGAFGVCFGSGSNHSG